MDINKIQIEYHNVITDIWKALKEKTDNIDAPDYWEKAVTDFHSIAEKYKGTEAAYLAWRMALAALAALEDKYRKVNGGTE